jgi:hypothetical protein
MLALVVTIAAATLGGQSGTAYGGRLSPVPISAQMAESVAGVGRVTATLNGNTLVVEGTYEGLQSPATGARLHRAQKGVRGPAVFELKVSGGTSGTVSGTLQLTPAQIDDLRRERFYVQIHSEKAPEGNLWGWLMSQEIRR